MRALTLKDLEISRKADAAVELMAELNKAQYAITEMTLAEHGVAPSTMEPGTKEYKAFASLRLNAAMRLFVAHCFAAGLHPSDVLDEVTEDTFASLGLDLS